MFSAVLFVFSAWWCESGCMCVCVCVTATKTRFIEAPKLTSSSSSTVVLAESQTPGRTRRHRRQRDQLPVDHNAYASSLHASHAYHMGLSASDSNLLS